MPAGAAPLFLARRSYRRRRMMDAARMLPLLGIVLFLMPALWAPGESAVPDTGRGGIYLFVVWGGLILITLGLARGLAVALSEDEKAEGAPEIAALSALRTTGTGAGAEAAATYTSAVAAFDAATGAALARARSAARGEDEGPASDPPAPERGR